MFCTRCGAEVEAGDKFCSRCGNVIPVDEGPTTAGPGSKEELEPAGEPDAAEGSVAKASASGASASEGDGVDELFLGGTASAVAGQAAQPARPEMPEEPGQPAAAGGYTLPDSAFEPQTQPEFPAQSSTAPAVQVVAPPLPEGAPSQPAPKRRKGLIAAAAAAAVVLVAAVAVGMFFFLQNDEVTEEPTRCSLVTLVVPEDEDGQPYSRYRVTLKDPSGVVVSTLDVDGADGFKLGDLTSQDGDYVLEINDPDTGAVWQQTPIRTDPSDTTPTITPRPNNGGSASASSTASTGGSAPSNGTEGDGSSSATQGDTSADADPKAMNEAYLEVVEQRIDTYGNANVLWYKDEPSVLSGVCVAELVDFNDDQQDELVVAYYDKAVSDQKSTDAWRPEYSVEVYTFDGDKAQRAYSKTVTLAADDLVGLDIVEPAGADSKPMIVERSGSEDNQETTYFALETPDRFQAVSTVSLATDSKGKVTCKVEGKDVSVEEYQEVVDKYEEGCDRTVYLFDVGEQPVESASGSESATDGSSSTSSAVADELPVAPEPASTRVVKCADELDSIGDTLAVLRSDEQGSGSSSADEPDTVATEAAAREAIREAAGAEPAQVFWADFDGDGTFEAFGIVGEPHGDEVVAPRDGRITLWFAAKDRAVQVGGDLDVVAVQASQLQSGGVRFLKLVPDEGAGKGGADYYGVKDGSAVTVGESDVNKALK